MNDKYKVKIDNDDSRYVKMRKSLKDDISQKVQCEDYDKIIDYIFALVFEHNKPKEEVRKEMEEIFAESADYIMDLLTQLLEKYYGQQKNDHSSDLIEEIYEDKPTTSKSLSSQVVKPVTHHDQKANKNLYNQAINSVKESGRRQKNYQNPRNKFNQYDDQYNNYNNNYQNDRRYQNNNPNYVNHNNNYNNYQNYNDNYHNNSRYDNRRNRDQYQNQNQYQQQNQQRRKGSYTNQREENINVGGRNLVIKKRRDNKDSPSRSRSMERDQSKERERTNNSNENNNLNYESKMNMDNKDYHQQNYQQQPHIFGQNYQTQYPSDPRRQYINSNYFQPARGPIYQMRRLGPFNARGRFPGRFVKQRFLGPMDMGARMPIMRKPFIRKAKAPIVKEGVKVEGQENTEQTQSDVPAQSDNVNFEQKNETSEQKPSQDNAQHAENENPAEEKDKKKIRCRNWPNCKNENCEYAHPSETCQYFPKCQFGNKCLYIHPNIPCKYGFYCTRPGCSYSHGSGYNPGMFGMMPPTMQPFNSNKFKKFHPKPGPKTVPNPTETPNNENNQAEITTNQDESHMVTDNNNNEQINA